jgi:hypothetical protein
MLEGLPQSAFDVEIHCSALKQLYTKPYASTGGPVVRVLGAVMRDTPDEISLWSILGDCRKQSTWLIGRFFGRRLCRALLPSHGLSESNLRCARKVPFTVNSSPVGGVRRGWSKRYQCRRFISMTTTRFTAYYARPRLTNGHLHRGVMVYGRREWPWFSIGRIV